MRLFNMGIATVLNPIFTYACFSLSKRILPFHLDYLAALIHVSYRVTIVVRQQKNLLCA